MRQILASPFCFVGFKSSRPTDHCRAMGCRMGCVILVLGGKAFARVNPYRYDQGTPSALSLVRTPRGQLRSPNCEGGRRPRASFHQPHLPLRRCVVVARNLLHHALWSETASWIANGNFGISAAFMCLLTANRPNYSKRALELFSSSETCRNLKPN